MGVGEEVAAALVFCLFFTGGAIVTGLTVSLVWRLLSSEDCGWSTGGRYRIRSWRLTVELKKELRGAKKQFTKVGARSGDIKRADRED